MSVKGDSDKTVTTDSDENYSNLGGDKFRTLTTNCLTQGDNIIQCH